MGGELSLMAAAYMILGLVAGAVSEWRRGT